MAENYLITGYWGEPHVTAENDRGINAAIFGAGRFVLPVGEQFRAEYIGNNTIRMYDGKLIDNGAVAGIPAGRYVDLTIPTAGQGMKRNDVIVFQYSKDGTSLVESGTFAVVRGAETSGTAVDPVLTQNDLLSDEAVFDQMALWRVPVSAAVISAPEIMFNTKFAGERIVTAHSEDGETYTANLPGIAKLYSGLEFTIIPDRNSATTIPKLNINGLGDVYVRRRISSGTSLTVQSEGETFLIATQPIRVFYNGKYWIADMARPHATDIYGSVPIEKGGTGADKLKEARANLGIVTNVRNILDNSNFENPVNQNGATSYSGTGNGIDRWECANDSGAMTVAKGYVKFNSSGNGQVVQHIYDSGVNLLGKDITIACEDKNGTVYFATGTVPVSKPSSNTVVCSIDIDNAKFRLYITSAGTYYVQVYTPYTELSLKWAALYDGAYTADTLPKYQPKGYAAELIACNVADRGNVFGDPDVARAAMGATRLDTLWTNASHTSTFANQDVACDYSAYSLLLIAFKRSKSSEQQNLILIQAASGRMYDATVLSISGQIYNLARRIVTTIPTGVNFGDGCLENSGNVDNSLCIPWVIYGIK